MKIDVSSLLSTINDDFKQLSRQRLVVGILDSRMKSAKGDPKKGTRSTIYSDPSGGSFALTTRYQKRKGAANNPKLKDVAKYVDDRKHGALFAKFDIRIADNKIIADVAEKFALGYGDKESDRARIAALRNAGRSLIRTPIFRSKYGGNKSNAKGFSHYGVDTGKMVNNIDARYYLK